MSKANTTALIKELKEQGQDFEFYPTTDAMIECLANRLKRFDSEEKRCPNYSIQKVLDIGAGDGRVLKKLLNAEIGGKSFMIEKATTHIENYDFGFVVGRDFNETSIIEKEMDLVFSNPPYSEFEKWACRIIKEANAKFIALILPQRWKESKLIKLALSSRQSIQKEPEILQSFDFENAERKARAKVDLILIRTTKGEYKAKDIFAEFLENEFGLDFDEVLQSSYDKYEKEKQERQNLQNEVRDIAKSNLIDYLVDKYNAELREFVEGLKSLKNISPKLLACLDIDKNKLIEGIKEQLKNLKGLYWRALFDEFKMVNSKIISSYREYLSFQVATEAQVEFTKANIHSVVIWLIKNANKYIEKSYLVFFDRMAREGNAKHYKSNERFVNDEWRYNKDKSEKEPHKLDYRIVLTYATNNYEIVDMIQVIANNLGYTNNLRSALINENFNEKTLSCYLTTFQQESKGVIKTNNGEILLEYKAYKNKNVHIKFNKDFMGELNLAVGKLRQWLRSKDEARAKFKDLKEKSFKKVFDKSLLLTANNMPLCLGYVPTQESADNENETNEPSLFSDLDLAG